MRDASCFIAKGFWYAIQIFILSFLSIVFSIIFIVKLILLRRVYPAIDSAIFYLILTYCVNFTSFLVHKRQSRWLREITNGGDYVPRTEKEDDKSDAGC